MDTKLINAYYDGVKDGVYRFAWWADGVQQVGTSGKTLAQAYLEIEQERALSLSRQLEVSYPDENYFQGG